jgi:putative lipase involved disintegration of autophagic bodies
MNIYIYTSYGERVEPKDDDIHMAAFLPGCQDDAAICKANSKEEAIQKFSTYYVDASIDTVKSLDELYWIPNEDVSILTTY